MSRPTFRETQLEWIEGKYTQVVYSYWNCPRKFLSTSVIEWITDYTMMKRFPSMPVPPLNEMSFRFREAVQYYEQELETAMKEIRDA